MKQENLKPIILKPYQIIILYNNFDIEEKEQKTLDGFEGWYICTNTNTGSYDSGKSSMVDYEIYLYNKEHELKGTAIGGYYNGGCGEKFNDELTFYPPKSKLPLNDLNIFLDNLVHENLDLENKVAKIKKYLIELEA